MKGDSALKGILCDLTIALSEDNKLRKVEFTKDPSKFGYAPNDETVYVNPKPAEIMGIADKISNKQEFLMIVDTQSHEHEHQVVSDLNSIQDFADQYQGRPRMASMVMNAVEDTYIDARRTNRDRGLKVICEQSHEYWIKTQDCITNFEGAQKYVKAVFQITRGNGTPKGFDTIEDEDLKDYCAKVRILIERVEDTPIQSDRTEIAHRIMSLIEDEVGEAEVPDSMDLPENMPNVNGDELPDANEDNVQTQQIPHPNENEESEENESNCPECDFENPNKTVQKVNGMEAARVLRPFNLNDDWVSSCEFIESDDEDGLCGFRVKPSGEIPKNMIMNEGYLIDEVSSGVEILEPKRNYDDTEEIEECDCPKCGHEWVTEK